MSASDTPPARRASLSTPRIVFLVVAAAAPLASMIGNLPIALARGNGAATPVAFAIAGAILLCFAVGYAAMSRRIVSTGAFYTYITEGLGTAAGIGSAYTALVAYLSFTFGLAAFFGYFTSLVLGQAGLHVPWPVYAAIGIVLVAALGYRSIDFSSIVLGALMLGEVLILGVFDVTIIAAKGLAHAMPAQSFSPSLAFTPGLGVSLMVAFKAGVPVLIGFGSFGIIFLQAYAAIAILVFLRREGGEPVWVMAAAWLGALGLVAATIFVAVWFKLLAVDPPAWVGLLPLAFPAIVAPLLWLGRWSRTIRPKRFLSEEIEAAAAAAATASTAFTVRGDADSRGPWVVRYVDNVGRGRSSGAQPSLEAAQAEARRLRDGRGATILDIGMV